VNEVAERLGISRSAAKTRLHRGRAQLRREILRRFDVRSAAGPESGKGLHRREAESMLAA
jgi:hypothetical protein